MYQSIAKKRGMGLDVKEIMFVKKECEKYKEKNPNALLWMQ